MALTVIMGNSADPREKIGKNISTGGSYNCRLKDETSILKPDILIQTSDNIYQYNYMYISQLNRYYFIDDIRSINNDIWLISAHVDVLETYRQGILNNEAVIKRQQNTYNLYLDDPDFRVYNYERIQTLKFPNNAFLKGLQYILVTDAEAGGSSEGSEG